MLSVIYFLIFRTATKIRNVKSDVAFYIGNDVMGNNTPTEDVTDARIYSGKEDNQTNNSVSNGTDGNYQNNILSFASSKQMLKEKKKRVNNRFGNSNLELGHSESAQAMSLLSHQDASSTNTLSSNSKKSRSSGTVFVARFCHDFIM